MHARERWRKRAYRCRASWGVFAGCRGASAFSRNEDGELVDESGFRKVASPQLLYEIVAGDAERFLSTRVQRLVHLLGRQLDWLGLAYSRFALLPHDCHFAVLHSDTLTGIALLRVPQVS